LKPAWATLLLKKRNREKQREREREKRKEGREVAREGGKRKVITSKRGNFF
jgi:hypothetical protein